YMRIAREWPRLGPEAPRLPLRKALRLLSTPRRPDVSAVCVPTRRIEIVDIDRIAVVDDGWKHDNAAKLQKLTASVQRYGQTRPVIVRRDGDRYVVVDGRKILKSLRMAGLKTCRIVDLGPLDAQAAALVCASCDIGFEIDYAKLAFAVAALMDT